MRSKNGLELLDVEARVWVLTHCRTCLWLLEASNTTRVLECMPIEVHAAPAILQSRNQFYNIANFLFQRADIRRARRSRNGLTSQVQIPKCTVGGTSPHLIPPFVPLEYSDSIRIFLLSLPEA
jgi:hypothetical protein